MTCLAARRWEEEEDQEQEDEGELAPDDEQDDDDHRKRSALEYDEDIHAQPVPTRHLHIAEPALPNIPFPKLRMARSVGTRNLPPLCIQKNIDSLPASSHDGCFMGLGFQYPQLSHLQSFALFRARIPPRSSQPFPRERCPRKRRIHVPHRTELHRMALEEVFRRNPSQSNRLTSG